VATAGDAVGGALFVPAGTDTATATDAVTPTLVAPPVGLSEALADAATATDASGHAIGLPSLADTASVTDAVVGILQQAGAWTEVLADTATAADQVGGAVFVPAAGDLAIVADALTATLQSAGSLAETLADSATAADDGGYAIALADAVAASDGLAVWLVAPTEQVLQDTVVATDTVQALLIGPVRIALKFDDAYAVRLARRDAWRVQLTGDDRFAVALKFHRFNPWGVPVNQPDLVPDNDYEGSFDASSRNDQAVWRPRLGLTGFAWVSETDNGAEVDATLRVALVPYAQRPGAYRFTLPGSAIKSVGASRSWADGRPLWVVLADASGSVRVSQPRTFRLARRA
jgi:hypothetical protein